MTAPVSIRALLLASLVLAPASVLPAQTGSAGPRVARAVDSMVFKAHLEFLADDALEGRAPGTRGGLLAQKYIAAQFERLGLQPAQLKPDSKAAKIYGAFVVHERHRHRYEFNNKYRDQFEKAGFILSGTTPDGSSKE